MVNIDDYNDALMYLTILYPQSSLASLNADLKNEPEEKIIEYAAKYSEWLKNMYKRL